MAPRNAKVETGPNQPGITWVLMLYIAADSTIANFAVESLKEINNSINACVCDPDEPEKDQPKPKANVVVAVQFAIDAPGGQTVPRYIFDKDSKGSIRNSSAPPLVAPPGMTELQALIDFLKWVYSNEKCRNATNYALILWGHGPELLLQPPPAQDPDNPSAPPHANASLYLTPEELRIALHEGIPTEKGPLDIIGFDTCSMSMFEAAYEIRRYAKYMVASQEEVPDLSFPYDKLVGLFRQLGHNTSKLLEDGVKAYVGAYQDYIYGAVTGMPPVTLTALNLDYWKPLRDAICSLACALLSARSEPGLPSVLLEARQHTRSFVTGLYVDLYDFCSRLITLLGVVQEAGWMSPIAAACREVMSAISRNGLVQQNSSEDARCHGVSLYFPYSSDEENSIISAPLVKGGPLTGGSKGLDGVFNSTASNLLLCARHDLICETEGYYAKLQLAQDTDWYRFIVEVWTSVLISAAPNALDMIYSAQQSVINTAGLLNMLKNCTLPPCSCKIKQAAANSKVQTPNLKIGRGVSPKKQ